MPVPRNPRGSVRSVRVARVARRRAGVGILPESRSFLFFSRIARLLCSAKMAAVHDLSGWLTATTFGCRRWRLLARDSRKAWIIKRGPLERWLCHKWVRKCFAALRQWCLRGGPKAHVFWLREVKGASRFNRNIAYAGLAGESGERSEPPSARNAASLWAVVEAWLRWRNAAGCQGGPLDNIGVRTAKALVHLRAAGFDANAEAARQGEVEAKEASEVLRCLNRIIDKVVASETREAARGSTIWKGMISRLLASAVKRKRSGKLGPNSKKAAVERAIEEGVRPVRLGSNVWKVERVLSVRRLRVGGVQALVRWAGEHPDTWEPLTSFSGDGLRPGVTGLHSKRRRIERLANATLGAPPREAAQRPARGRVQPSRGSAGVSFFKRLVRGTDARVGIIGGKLRLLSTGTSVRQHLRLEREEAELSDIIWDNRRRAAGDGPGIHVSIMAEDIDETDAWGSGEAGGGALRLAKRKRSMSRDRGMVRKSPRLSEDPGGVGRLKRRVSASRGRGVKRRTT